MRKGASQAVRSATRRSGSGDCRFAAWGHVFVMSVGSVCTHNLAFLVCTRLDRLDRTAFILRKSIEANAYATARRHANTSHFFVLPRQIQNFRRLRRAEPDPYFINYVIDKLMGAQRGIARAGGVFCAGDVRQGGVFSTQCPIQHTSPHQKSCRLRRQTPPPARAQNRKSAAGG